MTFPAAAGYALPMRASSLSLLCAAPFKPLSQLLSARGGYDQPGTFDYPTTWAFSYYLLTQRKPLALALYKALRAGTYTEASFATIAGVPSVASLSPPTGTRRWAAGAPAAPLGPDLGRVRSPSRIEA